MSIKTTVSLSAAALAALALLTPMSASAQRGGSGQPGGSYTATCSDARVEGGRLYAECRTGGRDSRYSSIEYGRCIGDIGNNQGMLSCNGAQARPENRGGGGGNNGGGWNGRQPEGSYTRSCNRIQVDGRRLYAQCTDTRGDRRSSSIEFGQCRDEISNINGLLSCNGALGRFERDDRPGNGGGNNGGGWGGGWGGGNGPGNGNGGPGGGWGGRNAITVYEDSNFRGASATFNGEMPNLGRRQLNDNISSMQMNGSWEACSDPYFRGTCQTFTGDVRNLNSTLINDRISSLRPVRGW